MVVMRRVSIPRPRNARRQQIPSIRYSGVVRVIVVTAILRAWTRLGRGQLLPLLQAAIMRGWNLRTRLIRGVAVLLRLSVVKYFLGSGGGGLFLGKLELMNLS